MKIKSTQNIQNNKNTKNINMSSSKNTQLVKKEILGVKVTSAKKEDVLKYIIDFVENLSKNSYIVTPNPEMIVYAASHPSFASILNGAEVALCDGVGLLWGAQALGIPLIERFTGVELVEKLCAEASNRPITIGFFGAKPGVAELTAECLIRRYPKLKVVYTSDTWNERISDRKEVVSGAYMVANEKKKDKNLTTNYQFPTTYAIDILFVALGFPKQEEWMASHINKVPVRVMVGVGGAFDYISGRIPRAPGFIQTVGLEWLYRLVRQPWRWKRQLALPQFLWMVVTEKLRRAVS